MLWKYRRPRDEKGIKTRIQDWTERQLELYEGNKIIWKFLMLVMPKRNLDEIDEVCEDVRDL